MSPQGISTYLPPPLAAPNDSGQTRADPFTAPLIARVMGRHGTRHYGRVQRNSSELAGEFDGAYNIAFLDGLGRMFVSRDPLGFHPLSYGVIDGWFAAANESVALRNLGIDDVRHLEPGEMVVVENGEIRVARYAPPGPAAKCYFEWVYFAHAGSDIDGAGVYRARASVGRTLAEAEPTRPLEVDTIVVPVPDTAKPAADAFAYATGLPCVEGVLRNRYVGRTFIEPAAGRSDAAHSKYTVVPEVLAGCGRTPSRCSRFALVFVMLS